MAIEKIGLGPDESEKTQSPVKEEDLRFSRDLQKVAGEFEKVLLKYMVDQMFASVESLAGGHSYERSLWQDHFTAELASSISENTSLGISEAIYSQLTRQITGPEPEQKTEQTGEEDASPD